MSIYKFLHEDRIDVLQNLMVRFTQPQELNDPFEFYPLMENITFDELFTNLHHKLDANPAVENKKNLDILLRIKDIFENIATSIPLPDSTQQQIKENFNSPFSDSLKKIINEAFQEQVGLKVGVFCCSGNRDDIRMWSHYANSHRGFVIVFDENHEFFQQNLHTERELRKIKKVKYVNQRPKFIDIFNFNDDILLMKSTVWEYEEELRAIRKFDENDKVLGNNIYLFSFPPESVKAIIFGKNMTEEKKELIKCILKNNEHLDHVLTIQSFLSEVKYELEFKGVFNE